MLSGSLCLCQDLIYLFGLQEVADGFLVGLPLTFDYPETIEDLLEAVEEPELVAVCQLVEESQTRCERALRLIVNV